MKNRRRALLIACLQVFAVLTIISIGPGTAPVLGAPVPSFFPGDWVVPENTTEEYTGGTADVTGNIIIEIGAKLILHQATIQMNPATDGATGIDVLGTLDADESTFMSNTAAHYNMNLNQLTTISNLVSNDISGLRAMFIASGFVTLDDNEIHSSMFGAMISQPMRPTIVNNTFRDIDNRAMEVFQSNANVTDNTFTGNNAGSADIAAIVIAEGNPTFEGNDLTGNAVAGLLIADIGQYDIRDCTLNNQGATDIKVDTSNRATNVKAFATSFSTVELNTVSNSSDASFSNYNAIDVEVRLESNDTPVDNARIDVKKGDGSDIIGNKHTDASGMLFGFEVPEYIMENDRETTTTDDYKPHVVWATADVHGRTIYSNTTVGIDQDMKVDITLDDIPPTLEVTSPSTGFMTNLTNVTFTGTTEPMATLTIKSGPVTVETDGSFEKVVKLQEGKNFIKVVSTDESGNPTEETVEVIRDTFPPDIVITTPTNGTWTANPDLNVSGTAEYGSDLRINGKQVTIEPDGTFSAIIRLREGNNLLRAVATDLVDNQGVHEMTVFLDSIPPTLSIVDPIDGRMTDDPEIFFTGVIEMDAELKINGVPVIFQGSTFSTPVTLVEGNNEINVTATDAVGNTNTLILNIILDTIAPKFTITSPVNMFETNLNIVTVTGHTEPEADIKVNGKKVTNDDGNFSADVNLETNNNLINVTVTDEVGNSASKEIRVIKDTDPPELVILTPEDGDVLNIKSGGKVKVTGSTSTDAVVHVNDMGAEITGTSFTITVYLEEGENVLVVAAKDVAGNVRSETLTLIYDTAVEFSVLGPDEGMTTKSKKVTASGTVEVGGSVRINGEDATVASDGSFEHDTKLSPGDNTITFVFEDAAGNSWTESRHVKRKGGEAVASALPSSMLLGIIGAVIAIVIVVLIIMLIMKKRGQRPSPEEEESDEPPPPDFAAAGVAPPPGHGEPGLPPPPGYYQQEEQGPGQEPGLPPPPPPGYYEQQ